MDFKALSKGPRRDIFPRKPNRTIYSSAQRKKTKRHPADVCKTLTKEYFIDPLTSADMRLRRKQSRPQDLIDAIRHEVGIDAFVGAECKKYQET